MPRELQLAGRMRGALRTLVPTGLKIAAKNGGDFPPLTRGGLIAQCHCTWPDDPQFVIQWNGLLERTPKSTVFNSPAWQFEVVSEFVRAGCFRLITVYRGEDLLAVLPLALDDASMLETPGESISDYLTPLVDTASASDVWSVLLGLLEELWDWSVGGVELHNIEGDSSLREILPVIAKESGWEYREKIITQSLHIPLPSTWDEHLASLDGHERKEIKRKIRKAQTQGKARWTTTTQDNLIRPPLERALAMMKNAEAPKADFAEIVLIPYLRRVCPHLARQGDFFIKELWIEDKPCASLLGLRSARGPMIYNTGYDPAMRNWSPGIVAFSLAIQDAIAEGHPIFNLLRGGEEYKKRMGATHLQLYKINLRPGRRAL